MLTIGVKPLAAFEHDANAAGDGASADAHV